MPDGDDSPETRWMTYAELAQARAIKEPAAVRLVQRRGWERQPGNDGAARVAVPISELRPSRLVIPAVVHVAPDSRDDGGRDDQLQLRVDQAEARADKAEGREAEVRMEAKQLQRELEEARQEREDARVQAAGAEGEAKVLREALAEARLPFWRRWLGGTA